MFNAEHLLKHLKEKTKENHDNAELNNLAKYIINHSITREQYCRLVSHNYNVYKYIEDLLIDHSQLVSPAIREMLNTDKSEALSKDIIVCGGKTSEDPIDIVANPDKMDLIGAMYVMEGSMLGGLLIAKHIKNCPDLKGIDAFHFFSKDARESTKRWKNFKEALNNDLYTEEQVQTAVRTAKKVFDCF